jgi:hypothetical protein
MFTVMAPFRSTSDRSAVPASGPVFLDTSGRRLRRARVAGYVALSLVAGYVILFAVAFFGGPDIVAPYLPKPAPAIPRAGNPVPSHTQSSTPQPPAGVPAQAGPTAPGGVAPALQQTAAAVPAVPGAPAVSAAPPAAAAAAAPASRSKAQAAGTAGTAQGNAAATQAPLPQGQGQGQQTAAERGKSEVAPGQTARPTPPPHP